MNFQNLDSEWARFLRVKSNISTAFNKQNSCKICSCLQLMKSVTCQNSCQDWNFLFEKLLDGIISNQSKSALSQYFSQHSNSIQNTYYQLQELGKTLQSYQVRVLSMEKLQSQPQNQPPLSAETLKQIYTIQKRVHSYQESLNQLKIQNQQLRAQLRRTCIVYEEFLQKGKQSQSQVLTQIKGLYDEQNRIKANIEVISKQVQENSEIIKTIQQKKQQKQTKELQSVLGQLRREKNRVFKDQETILKKQASELNELKKVQENIEKKLIQSCQRYEETKKEQEELKIWTKECQVLARHSNHLLTAADSVFTAQHHIAEFRTVVQSNLESLRNEVVQLKEAVDRKEYIEKESLDYQQYVQNLRKQMNQDLNKFL